MTGENNEQNYYGAFLGFLFGVVCRYFDTPLPSLTKLIGILLAQSRPPYTKHIERAAVEMSTSNYCYRAYAKRHRHIAFVRGKNDRFLLTFALNRGNTTQNT